MNYWLKVNNTKHKIKDIKATKCKLERKNLSSDQLTIDVAKSSIISNCKYGNSIELWRDNLRVFKGKIAKLNNRKSSKSSIISITALGPFDELSQIVFQQPLYHNNQGTITERYRSKVILGANYNGTKKSISATIEEILNYAILRGADLQIGKIDIENDMLFDECIDITCAEALCKVLRWAPGCALFFDYSADGAPAINVQKRSSLENISINTNSESVIQFSANRRDDLIINGVEIKYERENQIDDEIYLDYLEDIYPKQTDFDGHKKIVMNVELAGYKSSCQTHIIKTEPIRLDLKQWWKNHVSFLEELDDFQILNTSRQGDYPNELTEGTITQKFNYPAQYDIIKGEFLYTDKNGSEIKKSISIKMATTTAMSGTYNLRTHKEIAEQPPVNLAKTIYNATSMLQFEGDIDILHSTADKFFGKNISIFNDSENIVQQMPAYYVQEDIFSKSLKIKFGPPKHLYPDNISELFRINRNRTITTLSVSSQTSTIEASTTIIGGTSASTSKQDSTTEYSRLVIASDSKQIDINSNDIEHNDTAKFTEVYVCYNGQLATAKILTTTPQYDF